MKKPGKPKAKRARRPSRSGVAAAASGKAALGLEARAFLARSHGASQRAQGFGTGPAAGYPGGTAARATARTISAHFDQRETLVLLLLPFLLLATMLVVSQSLRQSGTLTAWLRPHLPSMMSPTSLPAPAREVALSEPVMRLPATPPAIALPQVALTEPAMRLPTGAPIIAVPRIALSEPMMRLPATPPAIALPQVALTEPAMRLPAGAPVIAVPRIALSEPVMRLPVTPPAIALPQVALATPPLRLGPMPPRVPAPASDVQICAADPAFSLKPRVTTVALPMFSSTSTADFGERLAAAARTQTGEFVIYNDKYRRISYPMGDVSPLFGVCTDVIVRAYRAVGVDLQVRVRTSRIGSGDASIDHRRTETLRRFFARFGQALPVTAFPEDYLPGDIVTYHRPQNRHSRSHIAIVSDVMGPSGRPMIVHNRGWGPQLEDALFVDRITGHYRYAGRETIAQEKRQLKAQSTPGTMPPPKRPVIKAALRSPAQKTLPLATP